MLIIFPLSYEKNNKTPYSLSQPLTVMYLKFIRDFSFLRGSNYMCLHNTELRTNQSKVLSNPSLDIVYKRNQAANHVLVNNLERALLVDIMKHLG